jgi:hypothetical protein
MRQQMKKKNYVSREKVPSGAIKVRNFSQRHYKVNNVPFRRILYNAKVDHREKATLQGSSRLEGLDSYFHKRNSSILPDQSSPTTYPLKSQIIHNKLQW